MDGKRIGGILLTAAIIGVVFWSTFRKRAESGEAAKAQAMLMLSEVDGYAEQASYYGPRANLAHTVALGEAFQAGGRRRASTFDETKYIAIFFDKLIRTARDEGRPDIVKALLKYREEHNVPLPDGG